MWLEKICRNKGIAAWEKIEAPAKQAVKGKEISGGVVDTSLKLLEGQ